MSASGPNETSKLFPAATADDQEDVVAGNVPPIVLGGAPFSSPDPATDGIRMLPLEDGTSAYEARDAAAAGVPSEEEAAELKAGEWKDRVEAAANQDELDAIAEAYDQSDADYSSVEKAIEKRQKELDDSAGNES